MNNALRFACLAILIFGLSPNLQARDTVLYVGTCRNVTVGVDGLLKLFIEDDSKAFEGYLSISGWLVGSGPVKGTRDGDRFKFHTTDPNWGLEIDWQGTLRNGKLAGEYWAWWGPVEALKRLLVPKDL